MAEICACGEDPCQATVILVNEASNYYHCPKCGPNCPVHPKRESAVMRDLRAREMFGGCIDHPTDRRYSTEMEPW